MGNEATYKNPKENPIQSFQTHTKNHHRLHEETLKTDPIFRQQKFKLNTTVLNS